MRFTSICALTLLLLLFRSSVPYNFPVLASAATARPNPDADGNYHLGDGVTAPKVISAPEPVPTEEARKKHIGGTVVLWVIVDQDGAPKDVRVARSLGADLSQDDKHIAGVLDDNARKAVEQYRFEPGRFHGKPVPVEIEVRVTYRV
jgi:periplasmic protein TonB